jgi:hypothetical protein
MIAFLAPLIAAVAPSVIKGVGSLFKKKDKKPSDDKAEDSAPKQTEKPKAGRIPLDKLGDVVKQVVAEVKSQLNLSPKESEPTLSKSYAPATNTRLQKAPLASLDRTPIPASAPFLPKGAAALPPLGNIARL